MLQVSSLIGSECAYMIRWNHFPADIGTKTSGRSSRFRKEIDMIQKYDSVVCGRKGGASEQANHPPRRLIFQSRNNRKVTRKIKESWDWKHRNWKMGHESDNDTPYNNYGKECTITAVYHLDKETGRKRLKEFPNRWISNTNQRWTYRDQKSPKILDQLGPGPADFKNLGPIWTDWSPELMVNGSMDPCYWPNKI